MLKRRSFIKMCLAAVSAMAGRSGAQPATQPSTQAATQAAATQAAMAAYKNTALSFEERAAALVSLMTLNEKANQVQMAPLRTQECTRLGIPPINWWSEGLHGMSRQDGPATMFPQAIGMAATWNPALLRQIAEAISDEARAKYNPNLGDMGRYTGLTLWCPTVNMARDPRWGRNQETFGEDPVLTSRLAVEYIKGLQGEDPKYLKTVATPKHFAMHSQETGRTSTSFDITQRTLREYYLPAFYDCFTEGKAASTMAAHNGINKMPCTENYWLLTELLRGEWHFNGAVVTDWMAVQYLVQGHRAFDNMNQAVAAALKAGIDVMSSQQTLSIYVTTAIANKLMSEQDLDKAVLHNLLVRFRLGFFDPPAMVPFAPLGVANPGNPPVPMVGTKAHIGLALQAARESIVMLQNKVIAPGYGVERVLPLDLRKIRSIALIGPYIDIAQLGNYSAPVTAGPPVTPLMGLKSALGDRIRIVTPDWTDEDACVKAAQACDAAIVVIGLTGDRERRGPMPGNVPLEQEGADKVTLELPLNQRRLLTKVLDANPITVGVFNGGSPMGMEWIKEKIGPLLLIWYPGEQGGTALAEILVGKTNPSGRLPMTFYRSVDDLPALNDYEIDKGRTYMFHDKPATFVFGHGLSYTTFEYRDLKIENPAAGAKTAVVRLTVANTGGVAGDEVVQLYVKKSESAVKRPLKKLAAFQRVPVAVAGTASVELTIKLADLAYWDDKAHKFILEPGKYDIMVGASSADIRLNGTLEIS